MKVYAIGALCLAVAAMGAQAEETFAPVVIQGKAVRVDVQQSCPGIQPALSSGLARAIAFNGLSGDHVIGFTLEGQSVSEVSTDWATREYRQVLRRAMNDASCQDKQAQATPQRYAFLLSIRDEEDGAGMQASIRPLTVALAAQLSAR